MVQRPRTQPEIHEFRREGLIRSTIETLAKFGIENTTIALICENAGVSRGLAGHYFKSKEDLLVQAYESLHRVLTNVTADAARAHTGNPREQLVAIVRTVNDPQVIDTAMRSAYLVFWIAALTNERYRDMNRAQHQELHQNLVRLFERASQRAGITIDAASSATGLLALLDGLWLETSVSMTEFDVEELNRQTIDYIDRHLSRLPIGGDR